MARLVLPHPRHRESFLALADELAAEGRTGDRSMLGEDLERWAGRWDDPEGFAAYVAEVRAEAVAPRDPGFVPHTTWWWARGEAEDEEVLGRIDLRHALTPRLQQVGGHVGYDVRPSARRRGHATAMLAAVLPLARDRGIDPVLVTCDADNVASRRVIERNGGVLEGQRGEKLRFWVPTG